MSSNAPGHELRRALEPQLDRRDVKILCRDSVAPYLPVTCLLPDCVSQPGFAPRRSADERLPHRQKVELFSLEIGSF
jgi:hypothetical protein